MKVSFRSVALVSVLCIVAGAAVAKKKTATVEIVNKSKWAIREFFLSPTDTSEWGPDQLGKHTVETGGSFTLTDVDCDAYDLKLIDEDGDQCIVIGETLCKEDAKYVITDDALLACQSAASEEPETASVKLVNKSKWDIHHLFLSASDQSDWGPDQFGKHVLEVGGTFTLTDIECDKYDVKVVDEDGDECVIEDAAICGEDLEFKITNNLLLSCEGYK